MPVFYRTFAALGERIGTTRLLQSTLLAITGLSMLVHGLYFIATMAFAQVALPAAPAQHNNTRTDIRLITAANLFGNTTVGAAASTNTNLPWVLQGVFTGATEGTGSAIIETGSQAARLYTINSELPGAAKLVEVHPDYVVIQRAGQRETLRFPVTEGLVNSAAPSSSTHQSAGAAIPDKRREVVRQRLEELRQRSLNTQKAMPK